MKWIPSRTFMTVPHDLVTRREALLRMAVVSVGAVAAPRALASTKAADEPVDPVAPQDNDRFVLPRGNATIMVEPYAPNIVRITLSLSKAGALAEPGYGFIAQPSRTGWSHKRDSAGFDLFSAAGLVVKVSPGSPPPPTFMPLDATWQAILDPSGRRRTPPKNPDLRFDVVAVETPQGKTLLTLWKWSMYKNPPYRGNNITQAHKDIDPGYRISATFDSPSDEHYYGLGQHQMGNLDLRDQFIKCWHNHYARGGESVGVPFMLSSRGYGLIWDNASRTTIELGTNGNNIWNSEVGDGLSFFVIGGESADDIFKGYRYLTGVTHLLPKGAYGYIQSKCIYATQKQLMDVAKGYRERNLPLDVLVVDFMNFTVMGNIDLNPTRWPHPAKMNRELERMGIKTMISVWPHFATFSKYYKLLKAKGWFIQKADGSPYFGWAGPGMGPNLDATNPEAGRWFWDTIRDHYVKKDGFSYIWLDETEPDTNIEHQFLYVGAGNRYFNVYPLFETGAVYDGFRRDFGASRRVLILARAAYLGAQRHGTLFWSSDILDTWDMLRRSVTAGLNFTASGMPYWCTDIGGFMRPPIHAFYRPAHKPLISPKGDREEVGAYSDYPELFVRWFQWGAFQPVMRAHGERNHNEVWSYGKEATPILEKYLRLRYQLLPYTYSLAYKTYRTGAPYMRALWMDFPDDPNVSNISDQYMFGPAFLVAPVTQQGATRRQVYLPLGCDWYNFWTNERLHGGQIITAKAPIDTIPLYVRAGSILPLGTPILDTQQTQKIASVRVYSGADTTFTLYRDDGETYDYEHGKCSFTHLHWDDQSRQLSQTGQPAWSTADAPVVDII
jgi:alpha-glucosidase/alpha-D-xyloside xylohydrolase